MSDNDMGIATMLVFTETAKAFGCIKPNEAVEYFEADGPTKRRYQIWIPKSQLTNLEQGFNHELACDEITFRAPVWLLDRNAVPYQND